MSFDQQWSKQDISHLFFLWLLSHRELENVLESSREREREKLIWNQVEKEKEGRIEIGVGYVGGVERKQEKKKKEKETYGWN